MSSPSSANPSVRSGAPPIEQPIAATLAPELLQMIFKEAEKLHSSPIVKQIHRLRQARVCRSWYLAQLHRNEYFVSRDFIAGKLLKSFVLNPNQAQRAHKLTISSFSSMVAPLLALGVNVVELTIIDSDALAADVLSVVPASLVKLNVSLDSLVALLSLPDIPSSIKGGCNVTCEVMWSEAEQIPSSLLRSIVSLEFSGRARIAALKLAPQLTAIKRLKLGSPASIAKELPSAIAKLGTLERLLLIDDDVRPPNQLTSQLVHDILEHAPLTLEYLKASVPEPTRLHAAEWADAKKAELRRLAESHEIKLDLVPAQLRAPQRAYKQMGRLPIGVRTARTSN